MAANKLTITRDVMQRKFIWVGLGVVALVSLYLVIVLGIWFAYSGRIMPGVSVAGLTVGGLSEGEVIEALEEATGQYLENEPALRGYDIEYDLKGTLEDARKATRSPFELGKKRDVPIRFSYNKKKMLQNLAQADKKERLTVKNPVIKSSGDELVVKAGTNGRRIIYGENVYGFMAKVGRLDDGFAILTAEIAPAYTEDELRESLVAAREVSEKGLALKYGANTYRVEPAVIASWFSLRSGAAPMGMRLEDNFLSAIREQPRASIHYFNTAAIENHLSGIAKKIDRDPVNATLTMKTGKVDVFALSRTGLSLDINLSAEAIITALDSGAVKANLVVTEVEPEITKNSLANLGIVELIAEGRSNFAGSPANRRHNIRVGAARFNGIIIEPRETFSFTKNLGAVDASTGYLPELVIKANETIPEFGGGLCQVSSTAFRAALNAGLPITARKQHAYPVTYYKPYGTDATIYIPNPDLKFVNDTGHHILIQTRIVGNFLYFDFYGTKKEITVKFAGNKEGTGAVGRIENVRPLIYDSGVRGVGSFTAVFWHFIYDPQGKLLETDSFVSKYDSPLKYPH